MVRDLTPTGVVVGAVTALFVPGDRPDRFAKAAASGADVTIIDLEDAVAPDGKGGARRSVVTALSPGGSLQALVRINDTESAAGRGDLEALSALTRHTGHGLLGVMVPKAGLAERLAAVVAGLGGPSAGLTVVALVESALGVAEARSLAAVPGVTRLAFGALDFALDVAADVDAVVGQFARAEVVIASRAAGLPAPLESPSTDLADMGAVQRSTMLARAQGFGGRLCIHPAQLGPVRAGFAPTPEEVTWARRIAGVGDSAVRVDDQMVDRPILERARHILRLAKEVSS